jgi:RHS repeat-associated protein
MTNDGGPYTLTYDAENRIASYSTAAYTYDGDGERVKKLVPSGAEGSTGTLYFTGSGSDPLAETDLSGAIQHEFVYFNGKRIARLDGTGATPTIHYYFSDHLGSASVVTNADGTVIEEESDYYPYGGERVVTDLLPDQNYKFTSKERDPESGLDYFGARYYSSSTARWLSPDWAANATAVPYAEYGDPQSLNLYGYVQSRPITNADVDGHDAWDILKGGTIGALNFGASMAKGAAQLAVAASPVGAASGATKQFAEDTVNYVRTGVGAYQTNWGADVYDDVIAQGEQGAMEVVTEAILTGGAAASVMVDGVAPGSSSAKGPGAAPEGIPKYNRAEYGNPSTSNAAKAARASGEGQPCPTCSKTMKSGTETTPTAQHKPSLKQHWHEKGYKMTPEQRKAYARSPESLDGSGCKSCQSKQGAAEAKKKYPRSN